MQPFLPVLVLLLKGGRKWGAGEVTAVPEGGDDVDDIEPVWSTIKIGEQMGEK